MSTTQQFRTTADAAAALDGAHQQIVAGEVTMALSIAAMCDLRRIDEDAWCAGMERWVNGGADGTPPVAEFAAAEIAGLLGCGIGSAFGHIRTVLNLRHRHPRLWSGLLAGEMRYWEVARVADRASAAGLDAEACARLDRMCEVALRIQPWARVWPNIPKWIIRADPEKAKERAAAEAADRFVEVGRIEDGHTSLRGQLNAADGIALDEALDHLADLLEQELPQRQRRAAAIGVLARMVFGQDALPMDEDSDHDATQPALGDVDAGGINADWAAAEPDPTPGPDPVAAGGPNGADAHSEIANETAGAGETAGDGGHWFVSRPGDDVDERTIDDPEGCFVGLAWPNAAAFITPVTRKAELIVHLDGADLTDPTTGVISIDRWGHTLLPHLRELLAGCQVTIRPVIGSTAEPEAAGSPAGTSGTGKSDVGKPGSGESDAGVPGAGIEPVDGYRVPAGMQLAVRSRNPVDVFPYGTTPSARCELDHTVPFDHVNKVGRGQTRVGNLGPLATFSHRVKTHGGWDVIQPTPGVFEWTSPLGYGYRVSPDGTVMTRRPRKPATRSTPPRTDEDDPV